jgi:hypothetical protein
MCVHMNSQVALSVRTPLPSVAPWNQPQQAGDTIILQVRSQAFAE